MTVLLPNRDRNEAGATLDAGAILEAIELLELQWPIEVRWSRSTRRYGAHQARVFTDARTGRKAAANEHYIVLCHYASARQTGETLWHELTHAAQAERFPSMTDFKKTSYRERQAVGYEHSQFEVEAEAAEAFNEELPLAR